MAAAAAPEGMQASDPARPMRGRLARATLDIRFSAEEWLKPYEGRQEMLRAVLLPMPPANPAPAARGVELVRALIADPVYQLK